MRRGANPLRRDLGRAGKILLLPSAAVLFVLVFVPGRAELAIRVYALVLAGAGLVLMVAALRRAFPPATPLRPATGRPRQARQAPETLTRLESHAALGVAGAFDLHYRLRPRLRELATELLASRRGIDLDAEPSRSRARLGAETWELVREDRPPPEERLARGIPIRDLSGVVESLENA